MISKAKDALKKLEFGLLEFFVGALMVIGIMGYFGNIPADLDWIDHTVSLILFSYIFYKLDITSILFGKTSKFANSAIIISYFSLFFKDIISYTALNAFEFKVIKFIDYFYIFFRDNLLITNIITFYIGIAGIFLISIYLTRRMEISHPSFLYAIRQKPIKNTKLKFLSIFILLLGFYYFVYNAILEWLEFVIDDPVVAVGVVFYAYSIAKHHTKFHANNFIFKIGNFSTKWYRRLVSLFHYKKTLPLAISGLLILHALSDLGVFAYSLTFLRENFYLEFLRYGHMPFLRLFLSDVENIPSSAVIPLFIDYLLNALSLIILLLIPVIVWIRMFSQKELHFNRIFLFFIYSSIIAYMLLPAYIVKPLSGQSITGVDISSISLLETKSVLDNFFPNKPSVAIAASLTSIIFGLAIYVLSSSPKIRKELYAISIIGGLTFYTAYLYYFFSSLLSYFYDNILFFMPTRHFLIGVMLALLLALSIMFYIGGYLMFLYKIVVYYHKGKNPEPIDKGMFMGVRKIKSIEKRMVMPKKGQLTGEVLKYMLVGLFAVMILAAGYKIIGVVNERACKTELAKFEIELRNIDKSVRFGSKELKNFDVPCKVDKIYFFDLNREINLNDFNDIPILMDSLRTGSNNNVFLVKGGEVKRSFYAGNLEMIYPYHICFVPKFDKISFFIEGAGKSAKVASACTQPECTFIPVEISEDEARRIIKEAVDFGCGNCPTDFHNEIEKMKATRQNVEMFRKFTFCDGITTVEILIRPKKDSEVRDFRFYEFVPKSCIDDLNNYLAESVEGNVEIKGDPLIMWHFSDIAREQKVSYQLSTELSDECRQAIQGLGVAQFVEGEILEEEQEAAEQNTPPTIGGLHDISVSGIGLKKNAVSNLWRYAQDRETNTQKLVYTIIDQTNPSLVDCKISVEKHVDCEVKQNRNGFSRVTIQVDDFEFQDRASFNVEVSQFCKKHERKGCVGDVVFWFDSCNNQEEFVESCPSGQVCKEGKCEKYCAPNVERKCGDDEKIYWFDSCGNRDQLYFNCRNNLVRNNCRNGQCCIGNFFCQTP